MHTPNGKSPGTAGSSGSNGLLGSPSASSTTTRLCFNCEEECPSSDMTGWSKVPCLCNYMPFHLSAKCTAPCLCTLLAAMLLSPSCPAGCILVPAVQKQLQQEFGADERAEREQDQTLVEGHGLRFCYRLPKSGRHDRAIDLDNRFLFAWFWS